MRSTTRSQNALVVVPASVIALFDLQASKVFRPSDKKWGGAGKQAVHPRVYAIQCCHVVGYLADVCHQRSLRPDSHIPMNRACPRQSWRRGTTVLLLCTVIQTSRCSCLAPRPSYLRLCHYGH